MQKRGCIYVSSLVIILLPDNAHSHVTRMKLQKLTELEYETLPHLPYSPDLLHTNYHFIKNLDTFLFQKTLCSKGEG